MSAAKKVFSYVVRTDRGDPRLLVFDSHDEPGLEVPKGAVAAEEGFVEAAVREIREESGIFGVRLVRRLGVTTYLDEEQVFLLLVAPENLPETFEHAVTGEGIDRGFVYRFRWAPVDSTLRETLVQGCGAFVDELIEAALDT